jgi:hypothetical protein
MTGISLVFLTAMLTVMAVNRTSADESNQMHAVYTSTRGHDIVLDSGSGALRLPRSKGGDLIDCSDSFQTCLTDNKGFAFSYFRKCDDDVANGHGKLRFNPHIISVLHQHVWMVFDEAPNYLFEYLIPKGLISIYVGATPSYDFREALHDPNFRVGDLGSLRYRASGPTYIGSCT